MSIEIFVEFDKYRFIYSIKSKQFFNIVNFYTIIEIYID